MWASKGLFRDGFAWRIGNGRSIRLYKDPWLIRDDKVVELQQPTGMENDVQLCEMLLDNGVGWDVDKVMHYVGVEHVATVLPIPLTQYNVEDQVFWRLSKNGAFTVKSCYWLARNGQASIMDPLSVGWRSIWQLQGPPKIRHFLWNALKGNMAVREILVQRHILDMSTCHLCGNESESICHALCDCTTAKKIWEYSNVIQTIEGVPMSSFAELWLWIRNRVSSGELLHIASIMWAIWRCRNLATFDAPAQDPIQLVTNFCRWVEDYSSYANHVFPYSRHPSGNNRSEWRTPHASFVKINTDAHIGVCGKSVVGVVFRDAMGRILLTATAASFQ